MTIQPSDYIEYLRRDSAAFLEAARRGSAPPLPAIEGCPGWNMSDLVLHVGWVHRIVGYRVENRVQEFGSLTREDLARIVDLEPRFLEWSFESAPTDEPLPPELLTWFEQGAAALAGALESASPDEPVGTWFTPNQTAGFWRRRMAHEIAVHRWDAQRAVGEPEPIDRVLAQDGIEEMFFVMIPARGHDDVGPLPGKGESYHFHTTDGEGEWVVRFEPDGDLVTREHARAGVAVRGTTSDILLFLWGRIPAERLEVLGDAALLDRYFELVPPD